MSGRVTSFGAVAEHYDRFRPAPPRAAAEWLLPDGARRVADLGAGTGGFSRVLAGVAAEVVAVELDLRMARVAAGRSAGVSVVNGRAELLPLRSGSLDGVVVSSAWHWMDHARALPEIARVLRPGGRLGVVWNGPAPSVDWVRELLHRPDPPESTRPPRSSRGLQIPPGVPFAEPEHRVIRHSLRRTPSELVGLAGTYSRVVMLSPADRLAAIRRAAEHVESHPLLKGRAAVDVPMGARCWRTVRL